MLSKYAFKVFDIHKYVCFDRAFWRPHGDSLITEIKQNSGRFQPGICSWPHFMYSAEACETTDIQLFLTYKHSSFMWFKSMYVKPRISDLVEPLETFSYFNFLFHGAEEGQESEREVSSQFMYHTGSRIRAGSLSTESGTCLF